MSQTITAHFGTLRRAVKESRKYGVSHTFEAIERTIFTDGEFTHDLTADRKLRISRAPGRRRWKMAVDVCGRVVPAHTMPSALAELLRQPQFG
jgi:hypothetical protein